MTPKHLDEYCYASARILYRQTGKVMLSSWSFDEVGEDGIYPGKWIPLA